ncbi:hypothetical protein PHOSAC3_140106 [Mesotoga infera]|nr:hypothetical protein PHOSAC3_140106 [Mesotoga infera]
MRYPKVYNHTFLGGGSKVLFGECKRLENRPVFMRGAPSIDN